MKRFVEYLSAEIQKEKKQTIVDTGVYKVNQQFRTVLSTKRKDIGDTLRTFKSIEIEPYTKKEEHNLRFVTERTNDRRYIKFHYAPPITKEAALIIGKHLNEKPADDEYELLLDIITKQLSGMDVYKVVSKDLV